MPASALTAPADSHSRPLPKSSNADGSPDPCPQTSARAIRHAPRSHLQTLSCPSSSQPKTSIAWFVFSTQPSFAMPPWKLPNLQPGRPNTLRAGIRFGSDLSHPILDCLRRRATCKVASYEKGTLDSAIALPLRIGIAKGIRKACTIVYIKTIRFCTYNCNGLSYVGYRKLYLLDGTSRYDGYRIPGQNRAQAPLNKRCPLWTR